MQANAKIVDRILLGFHPGEQRLGSIGMRGAGMRQLDRVPAIEDFVAPHWTTLCVDWIPAAAQCSFSRRLIAC